MKEPKKNAWREQSVTEPTRPEWLTAKEWAWVQSLKRVAKKMPGTLCLHSGVGIVRHKQYMIGMLIGDESEPISWGGMIDGGDPDMVGTRKEFEEWERNQ